MGTVIKDKKKGIQRARENGTVTKGGGGWLNILQLDSKKTRDSRYILRWYCEYRLQAGSASRPKMRVLVDSDPKGAHTAPSADNEWQTWSGWEIMKFNKGDEPEIIMEVRRFGGSNTCEFRRRRFVFEKVNE